MISLIEEKIKIEEIFSESKIKQTNKKATTIIEN